MKNITLYLLLTISIFANTEYVSPDNNNTETNINDIIPYIDGAIHDRIIIKLLNNTDNSFSPEVTDDNTTGSITLETIANNINSNVGILFPTNNMAPDINQPTQYYENELQKYRTIKIDENLSKDEILQIINNIKQLNNIDIVYAEPIPEVAYVESPNSSNTTSPSVSQLGNFTSYQGYLNPAPQGIDAKYAWTIAGGAGEGVKVIDVEWGWNYAHQDFPDFFAQLNGSGSSSHGTAVAGVVASLNDGIGTKGIAYNAQMGGSYINWPSNGGGWVQGTADAIYAATNVLGKGDVMIIEAHYPGPDTVECTCNQGQCNYIAMEYWTANFDAIQYATSKGITVVEAAGNGSVNLDHSSYNNKFNRSYRDSGAILVAASNGEHRTPACYTNYGSRIDVHGWGWDVATTGYGDLYNAGGQNKYYTNTFSGTSSATPIVAGAVTSLQGIAKQRIARFLTPEEVRSILSSTATPQSGGNSKRIAGLPNLRNAISHLPAKAVIPKKPSNILLTEIRDTSATLKWTDNSNNETGYRIYKGSTLVATLPANVTSYTINNLTDDTRYTYTIKAFNGSGESSPLTVTFKTAKNLAWMIPAIYYPILMAN